MTKSAECPLFTTGELIALGNLELARRAAQGDESARRALEIGIRESMLEAENTPFTLSGVEKGQRESDSGV